VEINRQIFSAMRQNQVFCPGLVTFARTDVSDVIGVGDADPHLRHSGSGTFPPGMDPGYNYRPWMKREGNWTDEMGDLGLASYKQRRSSSV
jgi:hypothetical protein